MSDMQRVTSLCNLLVDMEKAVAEYESRVKALKAETLRIKRVDLPELMREFGIAYFGLPDGTKVELLDDFDVKIEDFSKDEAFGWLNENGFGGIIKNAILVEMPRGSASETEQAAAAVRQHATSVLVSTSIHPQTLRSFTKEQLAKGASLPPNLFSINPFSYVKLTLPKDKS